ncbi:hypothetical protein Dalk_R0062 [Desulfatibacillum aliphaticivorans]|uniref:Phosphoadenosine phosphosulphate reductase domain-containing protein n=2 Tax=Desulfatibacillum aliphaticivorans TaxID=218208 RepID=B8FNL3_DESAL|nr:hypothetical protein Dalk_R0062 [Desulfatibacillum aliphaticivorans]
MLLMMLERGEPIHSVVFFDTGWEFPEMLEHIDLLKRRTGVSVWKLYPRIPFDFRMLHRPVIAKSGQNKGKVHRVGYGWPSTMRRWCTREKVGQIEYFQKNLPSPVSCIGYAADETHRAKKGSKDTSKRYPLIEWGITEHQALEYCKSKGYNWGGLYDIFDRVSCFCCPFQNLGSLRKLRHHFPALWERVLKMDDARPSHNVGFKDYVSVRQLDQRFAEEDRQMKIFA